VAKSLKEQLVEQAERLEKTRKLKESLAKVESNIRAAAEAGKINRSVKSGQPSK